MTKCWRYSSVVVVVGGGGGDGGGGGCVCVCVCVWGGVALVTFTLL